MSQIKTQAIVIKSINWSDTSKIVSLYTREHGRVDAIAKGVKRKNHPYSGYFESINLLETIIYHSENRELQTIGETALLNTFYQIRSDLEKTSVALAILELTDIFLQQGDSDTVFFDFLLSQIQALEESKSHWIIFWYFILKLLSYLGFKPQFEECHSCGKLKNEAMFFQKTSGSLFCADCIGEPKLFVKLNSNLVQFLNKLQKTNHKTISTFEMNQNFNFSNFAFLLDYLRFHTEHKVELNSLKMII